MKKGIVISSLLFSSLLLTACTDTSEPQKVEDKEIETVTETILNEDTTEASPKSASSGTYKVYRADENAINVEEEILTMQVGMVDELNATFLFNELKTASNDEKLYTTVPIDVELLESSVVDGELTLNFSENVLTSVMGSAGEMLFVESVNKTMFENLPEVQHITYFINGEKAVSLSHLDVSEGFPRP